MHKSQIFTVCCLGFLGGVLIASFFNIPENTLFLIALILIVLSAVFWKVNKIKYIFLVSIFLLIGVLHFYNSKEVILSADLIYAGQELNFDGRVVRNPDVRQDRTFLVVRPENENFEFEGDIRITTESNKKYKHGDVLAIYGIIDEPQDFTDDFDWPAFLAKEGIAYTMLYPEIEKSGEGKLSLPSFAGRLNAHLQEGLNNSLLASNRSIYSAMVLGNRGDLNSAQQENLQEAGLAHIVAISGMHITIIFVLMLTAVLMLGFWRPHASYAAIALIIFYIFVIGFPASAVRAGIMASCIFLAERFGRPNSTWRALLLAATIMVAVNPLILRYDVGFQLSFAAVTGIILFSQKLKYHLEKVRIFPAREVMSMTIPAQVFTLPLVFYNFDHIPYTAPIANALVLPVLPFVISSGFIASFAGLFDGFAARILAAPAWLFSEYIWSVVSLLS